MRDYYIMDLVSAQTVNKEGIKNSKEKEMRFVTYPRATIFLGLDMSVLASRSKPTSTRLDILETDAASFCFLTTQTHQEAILGEELFGLFREILLHMLRYRHGEEARCCCFIELLLV
jgi:hypothetical protein